MTRDSVKKFILPPGPILSLTLIGLVILSAILYYRAVKIQRFLEPALAVSQPKMKFSQSINTLLTGAFGDEVGKGIKFRAGSIFVDQSSFSHDGHFTKGFDREVLRKLGSVFLSALSKDALKEHISLIVVGVRFPMGPDPQLNRVASLQSQQTAWLILNSLYAEEPLIEKQYGAYFTAAALPVSGPFDESRRVEFRIVPTDRLHIEVLQRFEKYMQ